MWAWSKLLMLVQILTLPWTSTIMLHTLPASRSSGSCCLVPVICHICPQMTMVAVWYHQVHTPTILTMRTNEPNVLLLSDAQRRTIYTLSTPPGRSGVAIICISGPNILGIWQQMVCPTRIAAAAYHASTHHDLPDAYRHGKHINQTCLCTSAILNYKS